MDAVVLIKRASASHCPELEHRTAIVQTRAPTIRASVPKNASYRKGQIATTQQASDVLLKRHAFVYKIKKYHFYCIDFLFIIKGAKPGKCPSDLLQRPSTIRCYDRTSTCQTDSDCSGNKKCCSDYCRRRCMEPNVLGKSTID